MVWRRRDWIDLSIQAISVYCIIIGTIVIIWPGYDRIAVMMISLLWIPLNAVLKHLREKICMNITLVNTQILGVVLWFGVVYGIQVLLGYESFYIAGLVSAGIELIFAMFFTAQRVYGQIGEHIGCTFLLIPLLIYEISAWKQIAYLKEVELLIFFILMLLQTGYHFINNLLLRLEEDSYDDDFPYKQAELLVMLFKDGLLIVITAICIVIMVAVGDRFQQIRNAIINNINTYDNIEILIEETETEYTEEETVAYVSGYDVSEDNEVVIVSDKEKRTQYNFGWLKESRLPRVCCVISGILLFGASVCLVVRVRKNRGNYELGNDVYEDIVTEDVEDNPDKQELAFDEYENEKGDYMPEMNACVDKIRDNVKRVIIGKDNIIDYCIIAILAGGHILIEDVPGTGKTTLAKAFAKSFGAEISRIQFTADMLPADITGLKFYDAGKGEFRIRRGPIFSNVVLADEINRATPKTQSALIECMEECQVTIDGKSERLESPFMVIATQNPIETAGTYELPEAQLDRFLMKVSMGYPNQEEEMKMIDRYNENCPLNKLQAVCDVSDVNAMIEEVKHVSVCKDVRQYIVDIVDATRKETDVEFGASPRATLALLKAAKAKAYIEKRCECTLEDVRALAVPVLAHRIIMKPVNLVGTRSSEEIVEGILWKLC